MLDSLDSLCALVSIVFLVIQMAACMITLMRLFAINPMVSSGGPEGKFVLMVSLWVRSQRKENSWKEKSTNTLGKKPEDTVVLLQNRDTIQTGGIDGVMKVVLQLDWGSVCTIRNVCYKLLASSDREWMGCACVVIFSSLSFFGAYLEHKRV